VIVRRALRRVPTRSLWLRVGTMSTIKQRRENEIAEGYVVNDEYTND